MKRLITIMSVVALVGMIACAAPKKKVIHKKVKKTEKTIVKETKQPETKLTKFRLEYQEAAGKNCSSSAVYSASQSEYSDYIYYRGKGEYQGWSYDLQKETCSDLLIELARIAEQKKLYDNKFTDLDDEDVNKPRWLVTMKTIDGKEYSMVEYSDGSDLLKQVEEAFKPALGKITDIKYLKGFSHYHYNSDGSLDYRTDHEADGTVHGGYNPKNPYLTY